MLHDYERDILGFLDFDMESVEKDKKTERTNVERGLSNAESQICRAVLNRSNSNPFPTFSLSILTHISSGGGCLRKMSSHGPPLSQVMHKRTPMKNPGRFFCDMRIAGVSPDQLIVANILSACTEVTLLKFGLRSSLSVENSLVTMHAKCGCLDDLDAIFVSMHIRDNGKGGDSLRFYDAKLEEAKEILNQMDVKHDATVWKALLAACRVHGNLQFGERTTTNLFELEPMNAMPYVMLSNKHSEARKWDDAAKIRRLVKSKVITKGPGCSWIEMNCRVRTFISEDRGHPREAEIYSKIDEIVRRTKEVGYVPDMNFFLHDMDREGKEVGLAYHSEKLGLLASQTSAPIRMFKNEFVEIVLL
ncbi:Pentatricopeptide repeat-containing protein [Glycine soja]